MDGQITRSELEELLKRLVAEGDLIMFLGDDGIPRYRRRDPIMDVNPS